MRPYKKYNDIQVPEEYTGDRYEEIVVSSLLSEELKKDMKDKINYTDVTFLSLAIADFGLASNALIARDFPVAGGLAFLGVVLVILYHRFGS